MIPRTDLPSISAILPRLDIPVGRGGRTQCPIHRGDNRQSFSYSDAKGQWYCFRCGFGGDVVELIKRSLDTDFKGALRWLGIEPGIPPAPDPAVVLQREEESRTWAALLNLERRLREEFRLRGRIAMHGLERLREDAEDQIGWGLLECAYGGRPIDAIEFQLDALMAAIPRETYPRRKAA